MTQNDTPKTDDSSHYVPPEQIDDSPEYDDPSLWATHRLSCLRCGTEFPAAPAGTRRQRLDDGQVDVGHCPDCGTKTPCKAV